MALTQMRLGGDVALEMLDIIFFGPLAAVQNAFKANYSAHNAGGLQHVLHKFATV